MVRWREKTVFHSLLNAEDMHKTCPVTKDHSKLDAEAVNLNKYINK